MTTEEAIRILSPEASHEALWECMDGVWNHTQALMLIGEAQKMGLAALRAQQDRPLDRSRWEECSDCWLWARQHSFCPNCGRPLTEDAWAELERRIGGNDGTAD